MGHEKTKTTSLPPQISSPGDLNRLLRELNALDDYLNQASLRSSKPESTLPQVNPMLDKLSIENGLNLLKPEDRQSLIDIITVIKTNAPSIHMSFASSPSPSFVIKLITWLRVNIHPYLLLRVGLEPNIAAGCILRTTNKQFDFSLRKHFESKHDYLVQEIIKLDGASNE